jgi:hypothetical protein
VASGQLRQWLQFAQTFIMWRGVVSAIAAG